MSHTIQQERQFDDFWRDQGKLTTLRKRRRTHGSRFLEYDSPLDTRFRDPIASPYAALHSSSGMARRGGESWLQRIARAPKAKYVEVPYQEFLTAWSPPSSDIELYGFLLHGELHEVAQRIEKSRRILDLQDNWDGCGSPRITEATWLRAIELVISNANDFFQFRGREFPLPLISESDGGSVDVQWRTNARNILINIPEDASEAITFYAHDRERDGRDIEGRLLPDANNAPVLGWLFA